MGKKSPGKCKLVPYSSLAAVHPRSTLSAVRTPNSTIGRAVLRMRLSLEGCPELPVESFDHAVGDGMICCGSSSVNPKQLCELFP